MPAGYINVDAAIETAKDVLARKRKVMDEQDIVRTDLRHAVAMGSCTAEQKKWIGEQFPMRQRNRGGAKAPAAS
jgi:hypothetical protein